MRTLGSFSRSLLVVTTLCATLAAATAPISIVASNWKFTPNHITLQAGQAQVLTLSSAEGVHGLQSSDLGLPQTIIAPGSPVNVTVTPKKAGTYVLHCSVICGAGHQNMVLTVVAKP